ncbi:MAG: hypothetical protein BGO63_16365 [Candidatus Accumulibacter sp. 66-26]|nr:hypothetical protein [Accumulibacter sp.]OJW50751.1 MAG: hypothetical protein BGO63_16365 [Candidatus Accumulibacter sp. 66-26]
MAAKMLPIDQAEAGMVLADALRDAAGGVLLPQGATLTAAMLAGLRRREVAELSVDVCAEPAAPPPDPELRQIMRKAVEQRLRHLFRQAGDDAATRDFFQAVLDYRLEKLP